MIIKTDVDYRGISLFNSEHKLYANVLKEKLYTHVRKVLLEKKNGYCTGK
jgi:hypothetical protein